MSNCVSPTLFIARPFKDAQSGCAANCNEIGPTDCCDRNRLTPRRNRERVRGQIKDYVLLMLGAPVIKIELNEQQLDLAVDQSLKIFEDYAPREYFDYYTFNTIPGKSVYELPPDVGLVRHVFYRETPNFAFSANDLGGAIPIEYFNQGGSLASMQGGMVDPVQPIWGRMGEWVLYKSYNQMFSRLSSALGGWEWVGGFRHIKLYPVPCGVQSVIVHYLQKCKDWECVTQAMQEGALCHAKIMLGRIRSRIKNPPGPNGGIQLDGDQLLAEGKEEKAQWQQDLLQRYGDLPYISMG